jgi:hypothetical protein
MRYALGRLDDREAAIYVDADMMFFDDPKLVLDELGCDGEILVHEHRYSADKLQYEAISGRFNVGLLAVKNGEQAQACIERWRRQCLDKCVVDPANGFCGDQKYLDEWPRLYSRLRCIGHRGGGVAPWNVLSYRVTSVAGKPMVDDQPVVFYHFHALQILPVGLMGLIKIFPAFGYRLPSDVKKIIYRPYIKIVRENHAVIHGLGLLKKVGFGDGIKKIGSSMFRNFMIQTISPDYIEYISKTLKIFRKYYGSSAQGDAGK